MDAASVFHLLSEAFSFPDMPPSANEGIVDLIAGFPTVIESGNSDANALANSISAENLLELQAEYTRLFINAPRKTPAPPYASVYLSNNRRLMQEGYDDTIRFYLEAGVEPLDGPEPADHIFYELEFVGLLIDSGQAELLCRFLKGHLLKWYPEFFGCILQADPNPYYETIARITMSSLTSLEKEFCHEGESNLKNGGSL
ncbi:TorD/DmsD family molecular chaperone [Dissulfurimicrobium hydrothermale]|uniref:TorD/DmsD family molecular chaperone n=1 Tax=Dissulfurimicrobium hydrothermale TaxID=1750598 RepID=UPI001EDBA6EA|nr:molecular chaperone TorD family protein [Dissulfurimicrobium hydrothermale]UKL13166.1 molecular chaperone TorD family protein [Dissulfurimicrobium hydrothermale]